MIEVQAFRDAAQQKPQGLPEEYARNREDGDTKPARRPMIFLGVLLGIITYLQSFLKPASAKVDPMPEKTGQDEIEEAASPLVPEPERVAQAVEGEEVAETKGAKNEDRETSDEENNVLIFTSSYIPEFFANETQAFEFSSMGRLTPAPLAPLGSGQPLRQGPDPLPLVSGFGGGGGAGGGGGGGGAGGGGNAGGGPINDNNPPGPRGENPPSQNRAPSLSGTVRLHDLVGFHAYFIAYAALLHGADDPDGDALTVHQLTASRGTLTAVEGGWSYEGPLGVLGEVTFVYLVSDGTTAVLQTAHLNVVPAPPITGTPSDDDLVGTPWDDEIDGGAGNDNIVALAGNDAICGGCGNDHIVAGEGNDVIYAGCGNDIVFAGAGHDVVFGGSGNDRIFGEDGNDVIYGEEGNDLLVGGEGDDTLIGGAGRDELRGDAGNDVMRGDEGNDILVAGAGNDKLFGGSGRDRLEGGDGDDFLDAGKGSDVASGGGGSDYVLAATDAASDTYCGGLGDDTIDYSLAMECLVIDLEEGTIRSGEVGLDTVDGFETVIAGQGNDAIHIGGDFVKLTGGGGQNFYTFALPNTGHRADEIVARIVDFKIGDKLFIADFEIKYRREEDILDELEDAFEKIYNSEAYDNLSVKFRFDRMDEEDVGVVEICDVNSEGIEDTYSIVIDGRHSFGATVSIVSG